MKTDKPKLRASFDLDDSGQPKYVERDGLKHYRIRLNVEGAPAQSASVTYQLHPSYWDPVREVFDPKNGFAEEITSYGDFDVRASVSGSSSAGLTLNGQLSVLLEAEHRNPEGPVARALMDIKNQ
jgi:hypothetical protein